jgi:predicted aspartyl protease
VGAARPPARLLGLAAAAALLAATAADAQLYRWTGADGVVRYTNDLTAIPEAERATAEDLGSSRSGGEADVGEPRQGTPEAHVIAVSAGGPIHAPVLVNGVALTLMIDTGADRTVIAPPALRRAGVDVEQGRVVQIVGVTGAAPARAVVIPRMDLAGTRIGPVTVVAHDAAVPGADGLLGRDVLDFFTLTVDSAAGRAELRPR